MHTKKRDAVLFTVAELAAHNREVRAKALEDAAGDLEKSGEICIDERWLRARAAAIRRGE